MTNKTYDLPAIVAQVRSAAQVEALAQIDEAASIWLSGWDAATLMLTGGNDRDN